MRVADFDYELPSRLIATEPLAERDASRLLVLGEGGTLSDRMIRDLPALVRPGDVWVINDTKVIPARLPGRRHTGGKVEILLLEPTGEVNRWRAWGKSNRPLRAGEHIVIADDFTIEVLQRHGREIMVCLHAGDIAAAIEQYGHMPLPPYINRPDGKADRERYQTVFARHAGAVAAPTAGLHLTQALMEDMHEAGAVFANVTLHVGPGTFQPVQVEDIKHHAMHEEAYHVPEETARLVNAARQAGRRVVAVGTTSLRTLEAACAGGRMRAGHGRTRLFIHPGYRFHAVDALLTNFHLPRSTLLMLVCAMAGREQVLAAYEHAKLHNYRFYSYGDAMFVSRQNMNGSTA
ncbi:MAG: tRNA preQ1(34) S-adenosylmethionine ribosyltransferase-isomerase QueA [Mariprofundaceae bacterium]|nr:tRNA preQ1(34) S-adenosylmethionine ribosyltransferase-isomerase QueA [Mariprofundaceae bacterium]